jgi:hypothetical protein
VHVIPPPRFCQATSRGPLVPTHIGTVKLAQRVTSDREALRTAIDGLFDALVHPYDLVTMILGEPATQG